jgi:hypothetical protein
MGSPMTEQEARAESARLAREHPDRATSQFLPRQVEGGWAVVKVGIAPPLDNLTTETKAAERPDQADDPRDSLTRNVGPYAAGG